MGAQDNQTQNREAVFQPEFIEDLEYGVNTDRKIALRIFKLIKEILRSPFEDTGKPELLKYDLAGCWSRRLNKEHRIVYTVGDRQVNFLQAQLSLRIGKVRGKSNDNPHLLS
ncbi:MAG: Txe/YoeB family addiction module toxin [Cyanothece sp. SIO2G6]|nr:Txe/YoeB family addiction module toxin [Cyanothece sp. SIO2G6]